MIFTRLFCLIAVTIFPSCVLGEISIDPVFSDGMVLQRGQVVTIRGRGTTGTKLELLFHDQTRKATVGQDGLWSITLDPLESSSRPSSLTITGGESAMVLRDVLVGDVWLCSGQSNMGFKLAKCIGGQQAAKAASDPLLRVNNYRDSWKPCVGETAAETSGVAYFFARKLRQTNPDVPIGIIIRALSGTPIEYWTPVDSLNKIKFCRDSMTRFDADTEEGKKLRAFLAAEAEWKRARRKSGKDRKAAGRKPKFEGDQETLVLGQIYIGENPGRLWRERIRPLAGYAIKGVIWYQGERNTKADKACASNYVELLPAMIASWRTAWGQGDFRFLVVQLPAFNLGGPNWGIVQEAQAIGVTKVRNADYVETSDLPDDGLHPKDKRPVGERLAAKASM